MTTITIKTTEIKSDSIRHISEEIASDTDLMRKVRIIADDCNWGIVDTIESIASHIYYSDSDYTHEIGAWRA